MEEHDALLREVCAQPDADAPRLKYAEWLEQHGDKARAEFIRVQCQLAKLPERSPKRKQLELRQWQLRGQHFDEWDQPFTDLGVNHTEWRRGFVDEVWSRADNLLANQDRLFALAPIQSLALCDTTPSQAQKLARSPHLRRLVQLDLNDNSPGDEGVIALAASPHLGQLKKLCLRYCKISDRGVQSLTESASLPNLTYLNLDSNGIGEEGARALAQSPRLRKLTTLVLHSNKIGNAGATALATSPHLTSLQDLDAGDNDIGDQGARAFAANAFRFPSLKTLKLEENFRISPEVLDQIMRRIDTMQRARRQHTRPNLSQR